MTLGGIVCGHKNTHHLGVGVLAFAIAGRIDSLESTTLLCVTKQVGAGLSQLLMWFHYRLRAGMVSNKKTLFA